MRHENLASGCVARLVPLAALIVVGACGSGDSQADATDVTSSGPPVTAAPGTANEELRGRREMVCGRRQARLGDRTGRLQARLLGSRRQSWQQRWPSARSNSNQPIGPLNCWRIGDDRRRTQASVPDGGALEVLP